MITNDSGNEVLANKKNRFDYGLNITSKRVVFLKDKTSRERWILSWPLVKFSCSTPCLLLSSGR